MLPFAIGSASASASQSERWVGIVDDDDAVRSSLKRVLRMEGMCVETFASGEEFLERITRGVPSCLVLDVRLGAFTGFDLQDRLVAVSYTHLTLPTICSV